MRVGACRKVEVSGGDRERERERKEEKGGRREVRGKNKEAYKETASKEGVQGGEGREELEGEEGRQ